MTRKTRRNHHPHRQIHHKLRQVGFIDSPLIKGLIGMVPVLMLFLVGGLVLYSSDSRKMMLEAGGSPTSAIAHWKLAEMAALNNDYQLAEVEYQKGLEYMTKDSPVLGLSSELEDLIWPERKIQAQIEILRSMDLDSREIHLRLASLYSQLGEDEKARLEMEIAKEIDPNDEEVR